MWNLFKICCGNKSIDEPPQKRRSIVAVPTQRIVKNPSQSTTGRQKQSEAGDNKLETTLGITTEVRKDRYEGEELDEQPHGNGSMLYGNGDFYRGEWVLGKKEGRGLQIYQDGGIQYEGEWQNDKPHGSGKLLDPSGSFYSGEFKAGKKDGNGTHFDSVQKKLFNEEYENGALLSHIQVSTNRSREQQFPTLALDKERFNTEDLSNFENQNSDIKEFDLLLLLKYHSLLRVAKLVFIGKNIRDWTIKEVIDFLETTGLRKYKEVFYKNKVKGKDMVTLNDKELKEDLGMKMGDRKRFLNFILFLTETEMNSEKKQKQKDGDPSRRKTSLKFGSSRSQKRVLDNIKSIPIYEQSIKEEMSYSSESDLKSPNRKLKSKDRSDDEKERYESAAEIYSPRKSSNQIYSLEDKMSVQSERSSLNKSTHRKDCKDIDLLSGNSHFGGISRKQLNKIDCERERHSDEQRNDHNDNKKSSKSSSSSSQDEPIELTRKRTEGKQHKNSEIRELYQFLKQHRSLQFLIKQKDIQKLQLIGQGGYGKVYKGKYIGQLIAIKDYMKTKRHRHKQDFMKQLMIISDLKHPNIVLYMGICITADKFILVTEYLDNGSLFDQLHKKHKKFNEHQKIEIAYEIVKGMVYLHNMKSILHRDLKSSNVLIGEDWNVVKLCDFGLSGQKKKHKKHKRVGTYQWMAPEVIRNEDKVDEKADVYSFGVIIWELLTEKIPYEGLSESQIIGLVGYDAQHHLEYPTQCCQFLLELMEKCLNRVQEERLSFIELQTEFEEQFNREQRARVMLAKISDGHRR